MPEDIETKSRYKKLANPRADMAKERLELDIKKERMLRNVASADRMEDSLTYECKINEK